LFHVESTVLGIPTCAVVGLPLSAGIRCHTRSAPRDDRRLLENAVGAQFDHCSYANQAEGTWPGSL